MKMFLTMVRVLLKYEKDFLTPLEEFVYNKQKNFVDKTWVHQLVFQDLASDQCRN